MSRLIVRCCKSSLLFEAKRITLESIAFTNYRTLLFENVELASETICEVGDKIVIGIFFRDKNDQEIQVGCYHFMLLDDMEMDLVKGSVVVKGLFSPECADEVYDQRLLDILNSWDYGLKIDWKQLDEGEKYLLLKARGYLCGLPTKVETGQYIIDCHFVNDWCEFYLLLGDVIVGENGFFALGLDSLEDSLIELSKNNSVDFSIVFRHVDTLEKVLGEMYFKEVVYLLERSRISVLYS